MYDFNFKEPLNAPSWWYGIALDWVFAPTKVALQRLVVGKSTNHDHEPKHYLRWDNLGKYARTKRQLKKFLRNLVNEDDTTIVSQFHVFHTTSLFFDMSQQQRQNGQLLPICHELYHGHRLFHKLTHRLLMDAAMEAGKCLVATATVDAINKKWWTYHNRIAVQ